MSWGSDLPDDYFEKECLPKNGKKEIEKIINNIVTNEYTFKKIERGELKKISERLNKKIKKRYEKVNKVQFIIQITSVSKHVDKMAFSTKMNLDFPALGEVNIVFTLMLFY